MNSEMMSSYREGNKWKKNFLSYILVNLNNNTHTDKPKATNILVSKNNNKICQCVRD